MSVSHAALLLTFAVCCAPCPGQEKNSALPQSAAGNPLRLGSDDQLSIWALGMPEIDKPVRISLSGEIDLPMLGRVRAAGLTVDDLRNELKGRLEKYVNDPEVTVGIVEVHSRPVSVIGSIKSPGVYQVSGPTTLLEILSLAGGVLPEAGNTINITRRLASGEIPLANVKLDATGQFRIASVDVHTLIEAKDPAANIIVQPYDVISVPRARMVYVMGEVNKPGGYVLSDVGGFSALQAVSMAGGLIHGAAAKHAKVLRAGTTLERTETDVDLERIIEGKDKDMALKPDDILYIPGSAARSAGIRAIEAAIQLGTGVVIWHR
jgi:polysaccharide export outer membrane protein